MEVRIRELEAKSSELLHLVQAFVERHPDAQNSSSGITKFVSKIKSEVKFYSRLLKDPENIQQAHIVCSNYVYLKAIYDLMVVEDSIDVYRAVPNKALPLRIDLVANNGQKWIKVKAGNQNRLQQDWDECCSTDSQESDNDAVMFDVPSPTIIRQAQQLKQAAQENKFHYKAPEIVFQFFSLISPQIEQELKDLGITVEHGLRETKDVEDYEYHTDILNLDITTLLSMISEMSHNFKKIPKVAFDSKPLKIQYESEKMKPIVPVLQKLFKDRPLVATYSAYEKCKDIVSIIGGPIEKARAYSLFSQPKPQDLPFEIYANLPPFEKPDKMIDVPWKVYVIPNHPSDHFKSLNISKFTDFNLNVFGTADFLQISTITSNSGIKRALEKSGKKYAITIHESRGLIEQKWKRYYNNEDACN